MASQGMTTEEFDLTFNRSHSLEDFRVFYPDAEACYTDYARRLAQRFSTPSPTCEWCGSCDGVFTEVATWEVNYQNRRSNRSNLAGLLLLFVGVVHLSRAQLRFTTKHSICNRCYAHWSSSRLLTVPTSFVATVVSYIPVIITVVGVFYILIGVGAVEKPGWVAWTVVVVAAASIPFLFRFRRLSDLWTIPSRLRSIAKDPILFRGLKRAR